MPWNVKSTVKQYASNLLRALCALLFLHAALSYAGETILVGGATGRQGNAVVDELLGRGFEVRGLTRNQNSKRAQRVAAKGIELVTGDYGDLDSLLAAMEGIDRVFFYHGFSSNEVEEGRNVIAAAKASGVKHLVYSSGAAAEPGIGMQGASMMQIELALIASGVPYTVFRPVAFMENFDPMKGDIIDNGFRDSRPPDRMLYFIAIRDIGFFVGEAFQNPDEWIGKALNIASDKMTVQEYVAKLSGVVGRDIEFHQLPLDEYLALYPRPMRPLFRWYHEAGYSADVDTFRRRFPNLTTLEQHLRATAWDQASAE
jgi:uncharacterized protein YbjT (DUF2867 family)